MSEGRHSLLGQLAKKPFLNDFYLGGGTAVALYLGHRRSDDLDFFTACEFDTFRMADELSDIDGFSLAGQEPGTLHCFIKDVKTSFFYYPYPLLEKTRTYKKVKLASLTDLALMKLIALVQRGTKRDFIDLYFLDKEHVSFEAMLGLYTKKYPVKTYQPLVLLKGYTYFADAEREKMPVMLREVSWEQIKDHFLERQKELVLNILKE